ncbi:MAG: hypothetical protein EOO90_25455 [Pedobacter sp.]|nr:MAG: hypothetical protein EOO90_25455 [Pedobacter sp.]
MISRKTIIEEIKRLEHNSNIKRGYLLTRATRATILKKRLTLISGILAIVSAGAITSVLVKIFSGNTLQIIAAITSGLSGTITVFLTTQKDDELKTMFDGATEYLSLREKCGLLIINPNMTVQILYDQLLSMKELYTTCDSKYAKLINHKTIIYDYWGNAGVRVRETWIDKLFPRSTFRGSGIRTTWRNKVRDRIDSINNNQR